jgi:hypothetical protein
MSRWRLALSLPGGPVALRSVPKNRPLLANVAEALLGVVNREDGGEVLGHPPLNSASRNQGSICRARK